jgi:hypothetical protein
VQTVRAVKVSVTGELLTWICRTAAEDISVDGLLAGRRSAETRHSFKRWLNLRAAIRTDRSTRAIPRKSRRRQ